MPGRYNVRTSLSPNMTEPRHDASYHGVPEWPWVNAYYLLDFWNGHNRLIPQKIHKKWYAGVYVKSWFESDLWFEYGLKEHTETFLQSRRRFLELVLKPVIGMPLVAFTVLTHPMGHISAHRPCRLEQLSLETPRLRLRFVPALLEMDNLELVDLLPDPQHDWFSGVVSKPGMSNSDITCRVILGESRFPRPQEVIAVGQHLSYYVPHVIVLLVQQYFLTNYLSFPKCISEGW
jgi:hypothetical protein